MCIRALRTRSQTRNIKLRDVAAALVERAERGVRAPSGEQPQRRAASA